MSDEIRSIEDIQKGKEIATAQAAGTSLANAFSDKDSFAFAWRIGNMFSSSSLVPDTYKGQDGVSDCVIACNMANRIGCDPLMVMQNLYIVHNKPAWSGQFVIAAINQSGLFVEPLHFEFVGTEGQDDWGCYALGLTRSGREIKGPTVTIKMAKAEGWHGKNPKWRNMPELMLRYRAGAFFGKTECPELLMGFQTADEVRDVIDFNPETGEVIDVQTVGATVLREEAAQETETVKSDFLDGGDDPLAAGRLAQIDDHGYYEDGENFFNAAGEVWDTNKHGESNGLPIMNKDGAFRARRGGPVTTDEQETATELPAEHGSELDSVGKAETPAKDGVRGEALPDGDYGLD